MFDELVLRPDLSCCETLHHKDDQHYLDSQTCRYRNVLLYGPAERTPKWTLPMEGMFVWCPRKECRNQKICKVEKINSNSMKSIMKSAAQHYKTCSCFVVGEEEISKPKKKEEHWRDTMLRTHASVNKKMRIAGEPSTVRAADDDALSPMDRDLPDASEPVAAAPEVPATDSSYIIESPSAAAAADTGTHLAPSEREAIGVAVDGDGCVAADAAAAAGSGGGAAAAPRGARAAPDGVADGSSDENQSAEGDASNDAGTGTTHYSPPTYNLGLSWPDEFYCDPPWWSNMNKKQKK